MRYNSTLKNKLMFVLAMDSEKSSGHYLDKLVVAMKNFQTVYSAWEGEKLVGMICAMDDYILIMWFNWE